VIVERIFGLPGMGKLTFDAVLGRDLPVLMGSITLAGLVTMLGLRVSDLLYAAADPRISLRGNRHEARRVEELRAAAQEPVSGSARARVPAARPVRGFIASDRPIALRKAGTLYLLPNLIEYPRLRGFVPGDLRPGDWALWPPVRHGPYTIPALAELEGPLPQPPGPDHPLGTTAPAATSLPACCTAPAPRSGRHRGAVVQVSIGLLLGVLAGYLGGFIDVTVTRARRGAAQLPAAPSCCWRARRPRPHHAAQHHGGHRAHALGRHLEARARRGAARP